LKPRTGLEYSDGLSQPGGLPKDVFDGFQATLAANRAQFYYDVPAGPFYGYYRPGAKPSQGVIWNWWRQGMMGGAKPIMTGSLPTDRLH
jgi:non-heme chloroperoxidase